MAGPSGCLDHHHRQPSLQPVAVPAVTSAAGAASEHSRRSWWPKSLLPHRRWAPSAQGHTAVGAGVARAPRGMDGTGPDASASAPSMVSETNEAARAEMHIEPSVIDGRQRIVIKHFSLLKNDVTEEFDSPEKFTLCGEEFNLRLYPGGFNEDSRNYLGFYLKSHGNKQLWLAKSDYRIVNQKARPQMASADDDDGGDGAAARTLPDEVGGQLLLPFHPALPYAF